MRPEVNFLLTSLQAFVTGKQPPGLSISPDWEALFPLAESHGVLPLLYQTSPIPPPERFAAYARDRWTLSHSLIQQFCPLIDALHDQGIGVIPLKGPVLAQMLYGDVSLRPFDDLDLLVRREQYDDAQSCLSRLGFAPSGASDDYHRDFIREDLHVELHFDVGSPTAPRLDLAGAWERSDRFPFCQRTVAVFSPIDLLLYLALHGIKHRFGRLIWVADFSLALRALNPAQADAVLDHAAAQHLQGIFLASCEIAYRSLGADIPEAAAAALREKPHLAREADAIADRILQGVADPTTSVHDAGLYLQWADDFWLRWRQRLRFLQPTHRDRDWAARYHIPVTFLPLFRPVRLLFTYGPAPAFRSLFPRAAAKSQEPPPAQR